MFDFFDMVGNYEDRKVDRYEDKDKNLTVSTAMVTDSSYPYETAISHSDYNDGNFIIVESYHSKTDAKEGHKKWVKVMTSKKLPTSLSDVATSGIGSFYKGMGGNLTFNKKTQKKNKRNKK